MSITVDEKDLSLNEPGLVDFFPIHKKAEADTARDDYEELLKELGKDKLYKVYVKRRQLSETYADWGLYADARKPSEGNKP